MRENSSVADRGSQGVEEEFSLIKEVVDQFVDDHSDFCGAKVIFSGSKVFGIFSLFR